MKQLMQRFKHRSSLPISRACRRPRAITALLLAGLLGIVAAADEVRIANEFLEVRADGQRFTVTSLMAGPAIGVAGVLEAGAGVVFRGEEAADEWVFGQGRRLVFDRLGADGTGGRLALEVYPELPFVLVRQSVRNTTGQPVNFQKLSPVSLNVELGRPAVELVTLGTGGLLPPEQNPGSYLFLLCADPATRASVVTAWLTQFKGSGTVFSSVNADGAVGLRAQIEHGHLLLDPGQSADLDTFVIGGFADGRIGAERLADAIARAHQVKLKPRTAVYCSWYADQFGGAGTEASTVELGKFVARELKPHGMTVIQIDDEWQSGAKFNGPRRGFLEPRRDGPYPNGFEGVTRALAVEGLTFGLWTLPFARNHQDPEYRDRQHWFAQRLDGKPYDTPWGGTCLDLTHPEVREQIAALATAQRDWGVRYFKLDGLWTGAVCEQIYINDGFKEDHFGNHRPLHDPTVTNIEAYRSGLELLRNSAGPEVLISGCNLAQNMRSITAIGLVDTMRIGPDFNHDGQGIRTGPLRASRLYFMNGRLWWNDPDPVKVRTATGNASPDAAAAGAVSLDQARLTTSFVAVAGQIFLISDWLPALPPERLEVLKRTMLSHQGTARPVDYFDRALPNTWLVTDDHSGVPRTVLALFNWEEQTRTLADTMKRAGLDPAKTYHVFDFWAAKPAPELQGSWSCELPPVSCRILALRGRENHPVLVSTSRHVTQGMVDVESESWDAANRSLRLRIRLTGGDPNELRVAGLGDGSGWAFARAAVAPEDTAAGVQIESLPQTEPGWQRVRLLSPTSRTVAVTLAFAAEETDARRVAVAGTPLVFTMPEAGPRPMDKQRE
jgi:hypothetical protein